MVFDIRGKDTKLFYTFYRLVIKTFVTGFDFGFSGKSPNFAASN